MSNISRGKILTILCTVIALMTGALLIRYYYVLSPFERNYPVGKILLDVPFIPQKEWYCSEASASMVLHYYGYNISQDEIHDMGYDRFENMLPIISQYLDSKYAYLSVEDLKGELDRGAPVIIRILEGRYFHTVVVVGYEDGIVYINDPAVGPNIRVDVNTLLRKWIHTNFAAIVSFPRSHMNKDS